MRLFHPCLFPSIAQYVAMVGDEALIFERFDHYQKQTYRNRCHIVGPNGLQKLHVPIKHTKTDGRQAYKDVRIEQAFAWKKNFRKSLEAAYRSSPFFEYFEEEINAVFEKDHTFLLDLNLHSMEVVADCLQWSMSYVWTETYEMQSSHEDHRWLVNAKEKTDLSFENYPQVFSEKIGFVENLSVLDLLFNEGTNAMTYLKRQPFPSRKES